MPYITSSTTGKRVWSYADRDKVINWNSDQFRTAAERLARRIEEYLFDTESSVYRDDTYLSWCVAMFDQEKAGSGGYQTQYDPDRVALRPPKHSGRPHVSTGNTEVYLPDAYHEHAQLKLDVQAEDKE